MTCSVLGRESRHVTLGPQEETSPRKLTLEGEGLIFLVQGWMWEGQRAADSGKGQGTLQKQQADRLSSETHLPETRRCLTVIAKAVFSSQNFRVHFPTAVTHPPASPRRTGRPAFPTLTGPSDTGLQK